MYIRSDPDSLINHVAAIHAVRFSGHGTSIKWERNTGEKVVYKAGDTFIEATNTPHKVTNTGKTPTIVHAVIAGAEGLGPLTVFTK